MVKCLARGLDSSLLTSPTPVNPTSPLVESAPPSLLVPPSIAGGVGPLVASHVVAIVLFMLLATKTTATLTILQNRRQSVHSLLLHEEHYLRQLKALTMSPLLEQLVSKTERVVPLDCLDLLWSNLQQESQRRCSNNKLPAAAAAKRLDGRGGGKDPHQFIEYYPGRLLALLAQMEMDFIHRQADKSRQWEPYLIQMRQLIQQVRQQRLNRWIDCREMQVPIGQYVTLGLLAVGILVVLLSVATATTMMDATNNALPKTVLHLQIGWTVLCTCFVSIAVNYNGIDKFLGLIFPTSIRY